MPGIIRAERVVGQRGRIAMVDGDFIHVNGTSGSARIDRAATVTAPDIAASNGLIHVIDRVLLPI